MYGIGQGCAYVRKQLLNTTEVVAYSDSFSDIKSFLGTPFVKPSKIKGIDADFIIITIIDRVQAWQIGRRLSEEYGIDNEKIVPYFCCCNTEVYKNKTTGINLDKVENLVIGNSHAEAGYLESAFSKATVNLSTSAADLYTMYHTLKKCISMFQGVKKIIVDLYDYTVFNIDNSVSDVAKLMYLWGGDIAPA